MLPPVRTQATYLSSYLFPIYRLSMLKSCVPRVSFFIITARPTFPALQVVQQLNQDMQTNRPIGDGCGRTGDYTLVASSVDSRQRCAAPLHQIASCSHDQVGKMTPQSLQPSPAASSACTAQHVTLKGGLRGRVWQAKGADTLQQMQVECTGQP